MAKRILNRIRMAGLRRRLSSALCLILCLTMTAGCTTILGDGPVTIQTAPPLITPKLTVVDNYGTGNPTRFDIAGTNAFFLLPGIENHPDKLQDFNCLDYTDDGYFIYYYCGAAYIDSKEAEGYLDREGVAPEGTYRDYGGFLLPADAKEGEENQYPCMSRATAEEEKKKLRAEGKTIPEEEPEEERDSELDAMVVMAYQPETRKYKVMDFQLYDKNTAASETGAKTGMDFYHSTVGFYLLSHCYGSKIAGMHAYFILDQKGQATVWNDSFRMVSRTLIGDRIMGKVSEAATDLRLQAASGSDDSLSGDNSDEAKESRKEAKKEISSAKGTPYEETEEEKLNCLIKSAVMDAAGVIFVSLFLYRGDEPWLSTVLLDRVVQLYSVDLSAGDLGFVASGAVRVGDDYGMPFVSDNDSFPAIIGGYRNLDEDYARGYAALAMGMLTDTSRNIAAAARAVAFLGSKDEDWFKKEYGEDFEAEEANYEMLVSSSGISEEDLKVLYKIGAYIDGLPLAGIRSVEEILEGIENYLYYGDAAVSPENSEERDDKILLRSLFGLESPLIRYLRDGFARRDWNNNKRDDWFQRDEEYTEMKAAWAQLSPEGRQSLKKTLPSYYRAAESLFIDEDTLKALIKGESSKLTEKERTPTWSDFLVFLAEFGLVPLVSYKGSTGFPDSEEAARRQTGVNPLTGKQETSFDRDQALLMIRRSSTDYSLLSGLPRITLIEMPDGQGAWVTPEQFDEEGNPTAWRLHFPKGSVAHFTDMDNTPGSTTASVTAGALLFADEAKDTKEGLVFTSQIRWEQESGINLKDEKVPGAAIDSGALEYGTGAARKIMPMLITDQGLKLYSRYDKDGMATGKPVYLANEDFLTTTGFTPYTESATQASVSKKLGEGEEESYADFEGKSNTTEEKIAKSLNSTRVGTIQSASSFTMLSEDEVLISAYDSGLTALRLNEEHSFLHLRTGSYYQSFPVTGKNAVYKLLGFDTEEYEYGSMDLARAKVYDLDLGQRKNEIYLNALKRQLDKYAADYVRRLNRTRTEFTIDAEGRITGETVKVISFTDDHAEEAEIERRLFAGNESTAIAELQVQESGIGLAHQPEAVTYLKALKEQVKAQQQALSEALTLTGAMKLGNGIIETDPYWVDVKQRMQSATELGDLKDLLAEAAMAEEVVKAMTDADTRERYQEMRKILNYRSEEEEKNAALGEETISAKEFEELLQNRKTAKDYEEQYDLALRGNAPEVDPLEEYLNTDNLTKRTQEKENAENGRATVREEVLEDIKETWYAAHPLKEEAVYAPDGSYEMLVTQERINEAWDSYLTDLLKRINPDNLTVKREELTEEKKEGLLAGASSAAREMAQLTEFICEDAGSVTLKEKISMVEDLLIAMEMATGPQMAEEMVLLERTKLSKYQGYRAAYDAFNQTDFGASDQQTDSQVQGGSTEMELSTENSIRLVKYRESEFYQKLIVPMQESALVKAYLDSQGYTWEQYMASLPTIVQSETQENEEWDPAKEAERVYETFERFTPPAPEDAVTAADGNEKKPTYEEAAEESQQ